MRLEKTAGLRSGFFRGLAIIVEGRFRSGFLLSFGAPIRKVMGIEHDTEEIAEQEAILCRLDADDANDQAIYRRDDTAVP